MADVTIEVVHGDALETAADVLVLKYAQALHGVDLIAAGRLTASGRTLAVPGPWSTRLEQTLGALTPPLVLFVGVPPLYEFRYAEIRRFATTALAALAASAPDARTVTLTLHGPGHGLDEAEALESEVAGLVDAIRAETVPGALERIQIVERDRGSVQRMQEQLSTLFPGGAVSGRARSLPPNAVPSAASYSPTALPGTRPRTKREADPDRADSLGRDDAWLERAGYATEAKRHILVAMPFHDSFKDLYHYGIENAARAAGYVCERADFATFTGDVMAWVRARIASASLVIAEISDANPNVYLEVGYAWGVGVPTVLIARKDAEIRFDIQGERRLPYGSIQELEELLTSELRGLADDG
ncbi:MAG: hypothetical protein WEB13_04590 [Dehalococcoidia bacterium]